MRKLIIFGTGDHGEQAEYYFSSDSAYEVVAFTLPADRIESDRFKGYPVIPFEEIAARFPPDQYDMFIAMSGRDMNTKRREIFDAAKAKKYFLASYVSSRASIANAIIGENCFILDYVTIQPFCTIGNDVIVWCHAHIGHHSTIGNHIFVSSYAGISGRCVVEDYCFLAGRSSVNSSIRLAEGTFLAFFTLIMRDTEAWSVYTGNPAQKRKTSSRKLRYL